MWMMGYNEAEEFNLPESFNGRKLRPLVPRPVSANSTTNAATTNPHYLGHIHGTDLLALNHHLATMGDQNKREYNTQQVVVSSRWNPTPEQLQTLEELYRRGTRTPSADQIQHITAQLRRYGKIEGKNVFYWFQNHKARERQKRRRQLESAPDEQYHRDIEIIERPKESGTGANRTGYEVEQTKNWAPPTKCSTLAAEKSGSIQMAAKAVAECRTDGWVQFDERELQHRRNLVERNATWQTMHLSCSPPPTHLINNNINTTTTTPPVIIATSTTLASQTSIDPKLIKSTQDMNICISPYREDHHLNHLIRVNGCNRADESGFVESQTLQLFPLRTGGEGNGNDNFTGNEAEISVTAMNGNFTPNYQFFEFLPLKN